MRTDVWMTRRSSTSTFSRLWEAPEKDLNARRCWCSESVTLFSLIITASSSIHYHRYRWDVDVTCKYTVTCVCRFCFEVTAGLELSGDWGLNPSSCLQTLIFEWKLVLNFNPWAKVWTFRHLTPQFFQVNSNTGWRPQPHMLSWCCGTVVGVDLQMLPVMLWATDI